MKRRRPRHRRMMVLILMAWAGAPGFFSCGTAPVDPPASPPIDTPNPPEPGSPTPSPTPTGNESELPHEPPNIDTSSTLAMVVNLHSDCTASLNPLQLTATDEDSSPTVLKWSISIEPRHGTAMMVGNATGSVVSVCYAPSLYYTGSDSFDITVMDADGGSDTATIQVTVAGTLPGISITHPLAEEMLSGDAVTIQWAVTGDTAVAAQVRVQLDDRAALMSNPSTGHQTFNLIPAGDHRVRVALVDASGAELPLSQASATVQFHTQPSSSLTPSLAISPPSADFGFAVTGMPGGSIPFNLQNTGQTPLTVSHLNITGSDASDFEINPSNTLPFVIGIGDARSVEVSFRPGSDGLHSATLNVAIDELVSPEAVALLGTGYTPAQVGSTKYRIQCGGGSYTDPSGNSWISDSGLYNAGKSASNNADIGGTDLDPLYQIERYDSPSAPEMVYALPIDSGTYRVKLHFAETYSAAFGVGRRVFDVAAEGAVVLDDLDIFARVGANTALTESFDVIVSDGVLNIEFRHGVENPKINAIEVFEMSVGPQLIAAPAALQWGHVAVGLSGETMNIQLHNVGASPAVVNTLTFQVNSGAGHEFQANLGGATHIGDHEDVSYPVHVTLGPGRMLVVPVTFAPTEEGTHDITLEFAGDFSAQRVRLIGIGGENPGHPFLHVVITAPSVTVDYDQNGTEPITLSGSDSHTHELGHVLTRYEWREGNQVLSTDVNPTLNLAVGVHAIALTIYDDNNPSQNLTDTMSLSIVGPDAVPGVLLTYYPAVGGDPSSLLDDEPPQPSFTEIVPPLHVAANGELIGSSPFDTNVMVRMSAQIDILAADFYTFQAVGGISRRLFIDGIGITGAVALTPGRHTLEARFAVSSVADLPLLVRYARGAALLTDVPAGLLTHNQTALRPVINDMPSGGSVQGGEPIEIRGLGFFPKDNVNVRWGAATISGSELIVTPSSIRFTAPPGSGTIDVAVNTPRGVSNVLPYVYAPGGPAPIVFTLSNLVANINGPTTAEWGSDGRLYVGTVHGEIRAYTFDDADNVIATQIISTLTSQVEKYILGIATNPLDSPGPARIYVAHSLIYANGGACFTGTSPYTGRVSVLTGPNFDVIVPLITGLPVSNHDHAINGMQFDNHGDLFISIGGNTNAGVEHCNLGALPESPYSACIVKAETSRPGFNGTLTYRVSGSGILSSDQVLGGGVDPVAGADVSVFAAGLRNPFDAVFTTRGMLYATDNGPNGGFGAASTSADSQTNDPSTGDELNVIEWGHYYGHPNRNRGRYDNRQNVYRGSSTAAIPGVFTQMMTSFAASTDGITEYRANTFNGALRGDLIAQKWNGTTYRVTVSPDGRSAVAQQDLPVALNSLDVTTGPGGILIGVDYTGNKLSIARPQASPGLAAYDIFPWRAPQAGGRSFVIGGVGFGSLADTTVTIGGVSATLTSVSPTRIRGTIPARIGAPANPLDVVVAVGTSQSVLPEAFQYLVAPIESGSGGAAIVTIDPGASINDSSTYTPGSFQIRNDSTAGRRITQVRFDLSTCILRDMVFDPDGSAGDTAFKAFSPNQQGGAGYVSHGFGLLRDGGYQELLVNFNDFDPGETFTFSIDVDPTSIRGADPSGAQNVGAVSGLELTGARAWVVFSDGSVRRGDVFGIPGSVTGSQARIASGTPVAPHIQILSVPLSPATVSAANQSVRITGPVGATVRLMTMESSLTLTGVPGGGFDIDPYEANTLVAATEQTATIGTAGFVDIAVTLTRQDAGAGVNHLAALTVEASGRTSDLSNVAVLRLSP